MMHRRSQVSFLFLFCSPSFTVLSLQMNLDQLSLDMQKTHQNRLQTDDRLQHMIKQRMELPVQNKRQEILSAAYDSPVTIIRGNTGCGKTTQVTGFPLLDWGGALACILTHLFTH